MAFEGRTTSRFDRELKQLFPRHPGLLRMYAAILPILQDDPYNRLCSHDIKKLISIPKGDAQYRIMSGHFRFRYEILEKVVLQKTCSLRREDTY